MLVYISLFRLLSRTSEKKVWIVKQTCIARKEVWIEMKRQKSHILLFLFCSIWRSFYVCSPTDCLDFDHPAFKFKFKLSCCSISKMMANCILSSLLSFSPRPQNCEHFFQNWLPKHRSQLELRKREVWKIWSDYYNNCIQVYHAS